MTELKAGDRVHYMPWSEGATVVAPVYHAVNPSLVWIRLDSMSDAVTVPQIYLKFEDDQTVPDPKSYEGNLLAAYRAGYIDARTGREEGYKRFREGLAQ